MGQSKEVTIYDIARKLNISAATVSRGLQMHPCTAKKTMKKILDAAEEMGYRTNPFARNLISRRTKTIGVIVPGLTSHFMSSVVEGIERVANKKGYNLLISHSSESTAKEADSVKALFNNRVDGLLASLAHDTKDLAHFDLFFKKDIPVIFFDRVLEHENSTNILIDNHKAAYMATNHLISQGCRRIVHITAPSLQSVYADRCSGYKQALLDHQVKFKKEYVLVEDLNMQGGAHAAEMILKMRPAPDGVFVANDLCAIGCMLALKQKDVKIPQDIAFVGFNNDPASKVIEPNLTTVDYSGHDVGETAARYLINHLSGLSTIQDTNTVMLRFELIVRESSTRHK
ncbi:MAG: LacI family DNA-binding transcriptional regulator [Bacteroidota bacterium]|nr:LacI family DNA-binding transcriptional regulator [Bacteroidota bacterium]MDP4218483.1 LacI family DNA-binding transcriptional regulator [Bacteroidota bacterium]MDP4248238.1 LacI family DNA-binding transcriptional regulator [Bacteroidota bacterium]MDP4254048.1 LacI family DNA-binding transcriptional regulator [Bacteroidota bacterium]MDP4260505.1 LacI family DNA-binding transcriptional regulator [Bacteroidota bacterium]